MQYSLSINHVVLYQIKLNLIDLFSTHREKNKEKGSKNKIKNKKQEKILSLAAFLVYEPAARQMLRFQQKNGKR